MTRGLRPFAVAVLTVMLAASAWAEFYLLSQNSLLQNGQWVSSKQRMQLYLVGAAEFLKERQPLAKSRLDLGTWSGFNEVLLNAEIEPRVLRLRFSLEPDAHLSVLFARDPGGYAGLRLSRNAQIASGFFQALPSGRFSHFEAVDFDADSGASDWKQLELEFEPAAATATLDGVELGRFAGDFAKRQTLGFRGGYESARVDDVVIELASGESLRDSFAQRRGWARAWLAFAAMAALIGFACAGLAVLARRGRPAGRVPLFVFLATNIVLSVVGAALVIVDVTYWSSHYFYASPGIRLSSTRGLPLAAEKLRVAWFEERLPGWIGDTRRLRPTPDSFVDDSIVRRGRPARGPSEEYTVYSWRDPGVAHFVPFDRMAEMPPKQPGSLRIVFIGSSQTWGAGAESPDDTFVGRTHQQLVALLPSLRIETLNLAINGTNTYAHLPLYMQVSEALKPDLVIINFGSNDRDPFELEGHLSGYVDWDRSLGADTVLLREGNSLERPGLGLEQKHERIDAVGEAMGVPVLDLHGFLNSREVVDSGFLWWDYVHLTSYGHERVADWLAPQLAAMLREREREAERAP